MITNIKLVSTINQITQEQQKRVEEAILQITKGENFTNEQVEMEIDK